MESKRKEGQANQVGVKQKPKRNQSREAYKNQSIRKEDKSFEGIGMEEKDGERSDY